MARKIQIITTTCRRCSKPLATLSRSIHGADQLKAQYDRICESCITPQEQQAILEGQAAAILNRGSR